jgi:hypothetical protein
VYVNAEYPLGREIIVHVNCALKLVLLEAASTKSAANVSRGGQRHHQQMLSVIPRSRFVAVCYLGRRYMHRSAP